jgi:two-component system, NarL family, sensor histidine kinase DevS
MSQQRDRKDALLEAGLTLASELSLPIVLQRIVDLAVQVTDARYGALGVIGGDGNLVEFVTTGISARQRREIGALPQGKGLLGYLITHPKPVRVPNIAKHARSVGFPAHHPPMTSFLGAPVRAMGKVYGNIYLTEKRSAPEFSADDEMSLVVLATQAGVAIANASLYEEMRVREHWLDSLHDITGEILGGTDADAVLPRIAEDARALANAETAFILSTTSVPGELTVAVAVGLHSAGIEGQTVPAGRSISGEVIRTGKSLLLEDASANRIAYAPIVSAARIGPAMVLPLRIRNQVGGALVVANQKGGKRFDERALRLVQTFADQASVAIEYGRSQADRRRLGVMEDRERIAKELHDGIIQSLFAVGMKLQSAALVSGSAEVSGRVEGAVTELDRVIRDLRNYIFGLRPGILADRQLDQALRVLGEEVQERSRITVGVDVDPQAASAMSPHSHEIVQLTREALSNVVRHAGASHAWVGLARNGSGAVLTIEDDGVGFNTRGESAGNGLRNMRERVLALGGGLKISSRKGKGTRLRFDIPL